MDADIRSFRPLTGVWLSAIACQHLCAVSGSGER